MHTLPGTNGRSVLYGLIHDIYRCKTTVGSTSTVLFAYKNPVVATVVEYWSTGVGLLYFHYRRVLLHLCVVYVMYSTHRTFTGSVQNKYWSIPPMEKHYTVAVTITSICTERASHQYQMQFACRQLRRRTQSYVSPARDASAVACNPTA